MKCSIKRSTGLQRVTGFRLLCCLTCTDAGQFVIPHMGYKLTKRLIFLDERDDFGPFQKENQLASVRMIGKVNPGMFHLEFA